MEKDFLRDNFFSTKSLPYITNIDFSYVRFLIHIIIHSLNLEP